jgi:glycosyltransferase involved in cell wall biosynthesis
MNSSIVTIVIPAYNAETFLDEAIQSVLAQAIMNWKLLIIDDGSTDDTAGIVRRYSAKDQRIQLVQQANQGVSIARNTGVQLAETDYIAFLDADDRWLPTKLAVHLKHLQSKPDLGISYGKVAFISPNGEATRTIASSRLTHLKPENLLYENPTITTSNIVVRRAVFQQVGGFDPEMSYSEDLDWLFRVMCSQNWRVEGINQVLVEYRITGQGLSSSLDCIEAGWKTLIQKAHQTNPELVKRHHSIAQAVHLRYLARQALRLKLPSQVSANFMTRALQSDWRVLFKNTHRTLLILLAVYSKQLYNSLFSLNKLQPESSLSND